MRYIRKLKNVVNEKIPRYYYKRYPRLVAFINHVYKFLDKESAIETMNNIRNLDPDTIYKRFLNRYYDQTANQIISREEYSLSNRIKRKFLNLARFFFQNKGKKLSMDLALSYLDQFYNYESDIYMDVMEYEIAEVRDNWFSVDFEPHQKPYTYFIKLVESYHPVISPIVTNLNPVGFQVNYVFEKYFEDDVNIQENTTEQLVTIQYHKTPFQYNGVHSYNATVMIPLYNKLKYRGFWYEEQQTETLLT